eukprot:CAMPEP_0204849560 /NCGR_PEP_ID=MMETSP1347-20130617/6514_1 /ASSEMBLY_ACC=CAM_ASM_000690 /TAXON_ID=215587 /ORGANISM="Aplanochytrium stocchinoi, Strain GSBS06" /LENGTH=338 /DNA_ID=CAMNT_0051991971 /DNA_START=72 /DNA_END=1089 /DNA_ORIENTATION=-
MTVKEQIDWAKSTTVVYARSETEFVVSYQCGDTNKRNCRWYTEMLTPAMTWVTTVGNPTGVYDLMQGAEERDCSVGTKVEICFSDIGSAETFSSGNRRKQSLVRAKKWLQEAKGIKWETRWIKLKLKSVLWFKSEEGKVAVGGHNLSENVAVKMLEPEEISGKLYHILQIDSPALRACNSKIRIRSTEKSDISDIAVALNEACNFFSKRMIIHETHLALQNATPEEMKIEANKLTKSNFLVEAIVIYTTALKRLQGYSCPIETKKKLQIDCINNRSYCKLELGNFDKVLPDSDAVLALDNKNIKALIRKSKALEMLKRYDAARMTTRKLENFILDQKM